MNSWKFSCYEPLEENKLFVLVSVRERNQSILTNNLRHFWAYMKPLPLFLDLSFMLSTPVQWPWQAPKRDCINLSSSVSSLLCSPSEKMLFIWPKPFTVPIALWGAYRPWDNSKSHSASFVFIKSFLRLLFKSASLCLVGETIEGNVKTNVSWT